MGWIIFIIAIVLLAIIIANAGKAQQKESQKRREEAAQYFREQKEREEWWEEHTKWSEQLKAERRAELHAEHTKAYDRHLVINDWIAGLSFRPKRAQNEARDLSSDDRLYLKPEPKNKEDKNAIKILSGIDTFLGYVQRRTAAEMQKDMKLGITYKAKVDYVDFTDVEHYIDNNGRERETLPLVRINIFPENFIEELFEKKEYFSGKRVIVFGEFEHLSRNMISEMIKYFGGTEYVKITKATAINTAIVGKIFDDDRKMAKINKLIGEGQHIEIFSEKKLQEMLVRLK